jgi:hypothetical protein
MTAMKTEATEQWCVDRDHPFVTYNPWLDRSYCRCGQRQESGEQPMDWAAKRTIFHSCELGGHCGCYATAEKPVGQ